jgi:dTDP-4-dehydrorhamnose reductase
MKVLLTGASGYVGGIINHELKGSYSIVGTNKSTIADENILCDLSDYESVKKLKSIKPDVIIHAAGNKDIKYCENDPEAAYSANTLPLVNLVRVFDGGVKIIYLSTDYVFEGNRGSYTESDLALPLTEYGRSKLNAEKECLAGSATDIFILRMSALYDINATFPRFILKFLTSNREIECYSNIFYSPTYYKDFTNVLRRMVESSDLQHKIYHSSGERTSRYQFAKNLCNKFELDDRLIISNRHEEEHAYLFYDLSLDNKRTEQELGIEKTGIDQILNDLRSQYEKN